MNSRRIIVLALVLALALALLGPAEGATSRKKHRKKSSVTSTKPRTKSSTSTKYQTASRSGKSRMALPPESRGASPSPSKSARVKKSEPTPTGSISDRIDAIVNRRQLKSTQWSVLVEDLSNGEHVYKFNSDKNLLPASNRKLFTTALALDRLGPDYRFTTDLYLVGNKDTNGRFKGNLIVIARGDPTFCPSWTRSGRANERFQEWADTLLKNDIRSIQGDLIVDVSAYEPSERFAAGWNPDQLELAFSAPVGAFSFNENLVTAVVSPAKSTGLPCKVEFEPLAGGFRVMNSARTGGGKGLFVTRDDDANIVSVRGSLSRGGAKRYVSMAVAYPAPYASNALLETLQDKGIRIAGKLQIAEKQTAIPAGANKIISSQSEPLSEIIKQVNQDSDNFMAEHVYKAISLHDLGHGSWEGTRKVEGAFLKRCGIDPKSVNFADGCGLSRNNSVSASVIVQLLCAMSKHPYAEVFQDSLSVSGEKGHLKGRMGESASRGRIRGKTGFLKGVSCLSAYVDRPDGQRFVVSILTNFNAKEGAYLRKQAQDDICRQILCTPAR